MPLSSTKFFNICLFLDSFWPIGQFDHFYKKRHFVLISIDIAFWYVLIYGRTSNLALPTQCPSPHFMFKFKHFIFQMNFRINLPSTMRKLLWLYNVGPIFIIWVILYMNIVYFLHIQVIFWVLQLSFRVLFTYPCTILIMFIG